MSIVEEVSRRMLSKEELEGIAEAIREVEYKRAASVEALKIVQRRRGWVSDDALREVSRELEMSPEELDAVATFYNLVFRKPVGRHVILLCNSISCWIMGQESIRRRLHDLLGVGMGETTSDGNFTLLPVQCLGACDGAPALMVGTDLHRSVGPDDLEALLDPYRKRER
jgi:NADH-quinone oxidoreductase subunit E